MSDSTDNKIEFAREFATLIADVKYIKDKVDTVTSDHERRIRALEEKEWKRMGLSSALSILGGGGTFALLKLLIGGH